jgi:hypothetical protein
MTNVYQNMTKLLQILSALFTNKNGPFRFLEPKFRLFGKLTGLENLFTSIFSLLKVPKCEIFDRSDFHYFYSIKPVWVGDFGAKI